SSLATGRSGSRKAAGATARASIGSLLPNERAALRAFAISFGGTRTIRAAAASRSRSSRRERGRQSSTALDELVAVARRPAHQGELFACVRPDCLRSELSALLIDEDGGVRALVRVDPNGHHARCVSFARMGR